tara:strand:+ start:190 stop:798 length:609 start_codon:yes stop_codon:yes gene_type:complete
MGCCESRTKENIKKFEKRNSKPLNIKEFKSHLKKNFETKTEDEKNKPEVVKVIVKNIDYNTLKTIKTLKHSHDSKVYLLEHSIIKKVYPNSLEGIGQFQNEVATYRYLDRCDFIARLLYSNRNELAIYLPYLDKRPEKNNQNILLLNALLRELEEKWKIKRLKKYHWDNVREKNGKIYLIDFGSIPFVYKTESFNRRWKIIN